ERAVGGVVGRAFSVGRRLDEPPGATGRKIFRRDVRPRLSVVAGDEERPIIRARPDHTGLELRFADRVERAVDLLTGHIARDRLSASALAACRVRGEVWADSLPRDAAVLRPMH